MLQSGSVVQISNNLTGHSFDHNDNVVFVGVILTDNVDAEPAYVFTNGDTQQGLCREDFKLLDQRR